MDISICKNLKEYRKNKGNTQEELAEYVGISVQAVSKWEREESYPDITLLPKVAAYYNVSVDDLLGVGEIQQRMKIKEYHNIASQYEKSGDSENRIKTWENAIQEFPNNLHVMHIYMSSLPDKNKEDIYKKIKWAERLINESTEEENYTYSAMQSLCYAYMKLGDIEKAKEYANKLPNYYVTQSQIMMSLLEGEEAVNHIQNNILMLIDLFYLNVINLIREGNFTPKENIRLCEDSIKLLNLVYDGNLGRCYDWTFDLYFKIAENYAKMNDLENTLKSLDLSVDHQIKWLTLPESAMNSSLFVNRCGYGNAHSNANVKWLLENMSEAQFEFCRSDERFKAIEAKLREYNEKPCIQALNSR